MGLEHAISHKGPDDSFCFFSWLDICLFFMWSCFPGGRTYSQKRKGGLSCPPWCLKSEAQFWVYRRPFTVATDHWPTSLWIQSLFSSISINWIVCSNLLAGVTAHMSKIKWLIHVSSTKIASTSCSIGLLKERMCIWSLSKATRPLKCSKRQWNLTQLFGIFTKMGEQKPRLVSGRWS